MNVLIDFIAGIGDAIVGLIDFVVSMVMDLVYIVQLIGEVMLQIPALFAWMPPELSAIFIIGVTIAGIYMIAGRK